MDLGGGLNGYPGICHGGFVATMLDEVCGLLIVLNLEKTGEGGEGPLSAGGTMYMTACKCCLDMKTIAALCLGGEDTVLMPNRSSYTL
jgi:hypothetical protein